MAFSEPIQKNGYLPFLRRHIRVSAWCYGKKIAPYDQYKCLLRQGLQFYNQWHKYINKLKVRTFKLEDLVVDFNMTVLDNIFASMSLPPPNHEDALAFIKGDDKRRQLAHTNSRKHRPTLEWWELCQVNKTLTAEFLQLSHGFGYYEVTRDTASHFFIDRLPPGVHVFETSVRVQHAGDYQTGIAEVRCMYAPEFASHSASVGIKAE